MDINSEDTTEDFEKTDSENVSPEKENFDVDTILNKIQSNVSSAENSVESMQDIDPDELFLPKAQPVEEPVILPDVQVETSVKKYVIHVDPENINYMENLTINERRKVINKILKEQSLYEQDVINVRKRKKAIINLIIMSLTFCILFPIFFIILVASANVTVKNYNIAKSNFSKLYKEQGKIRRR